MGLHLLHDENSAGGGEVKADIVGDGVVEHLALQIAGCIICMTSQRGSTHSGFMPIYVDEH